MHNALLGAVQPDGHWWAYFLELEGDAAPSICQYPEIKTNCCVMSGYRGLAMTSGWAVEQDGGGLRFNTYLDGRFDFPGLSVQVSGDFARTGRVEISVLEGGDFNVRLRMPSWSSPVLAAVNGVPVEDEASSSGWLEIRRDWQPGDVVAADFGEGLRFVRAPGEQRAVAVLRGPLVLALDGPLHGPTGKLIWLTGQQDGPVDFDIAGRRLSPPLRAENRLRSYWRKELHTWCSADLASLASPGIAGGAAYRVWFPQPTLDR